MHEAGIYPGTGYSSETGEAGYGNILNIPLDHNSCWQDYEKSLKKEVIYFLRYLSTEFNQLSKWASGPLFFSSGSRFCLG